MMRLIPLALAVLIAVTSQQMAMARGLMAHGSSQVILCAGNGTTLITLDRNGTPVDAPQIAHTCADCVLTLIGAGPVPHGAAVPLVHSKTLTQPLAIATVIPTVAKGMPARGPPRTT